MSRPGPIAVLDIGKTHVKAVLVDVEAGREIAAQRRPNRVRPGPPWPHFDTEGHWRFCLAALSDFHRRHDIAAISITAHGAAAALLGADGRLAAPILDYEYPGPETLAAQYDALRPPFAETGSPRLPVGLNLGAQLYWQLTTDPGLAARVTTILPYPQYWAWRLTGIAASDISSLGCHTDLWNPHKGAFSSLPARLGLAGKLAPPRPAAEILGPIRPEIAARTGLAADTPVLCGIHDSNASLVPHLQTRTPPFSVVSTGTWVVAMAIGGAAVQLDPRRDCLINVAADGRPIPSARFMGGREYDRLLEGGGAGPSTAEIAAVLQGGTMLMPSVIAGSGPFPDLRARWSGAEPPLGSGARAAAVAFYLALMTSHCLDLVGHRGAIVVEGPFAANRPYLDMLAAAADAPVLPMPSATGTSLGAALLYRPEAAHAPVVEPIIARDPTLGRYARAWRRAVIRAAPSAGD